MSVPADTAERHARQLARYAEIAMRAAEKLDSAIEAADEPETLTGLVGALHKVGRALRTSIALEAKLERDAAADARAAADAERARTERAVEIRKAQVRDQVDRQIWAEFPPTEAEVRTADLDERLEVDAPDDDFLDEPLDAQMDRIAGDLGLTGEVRYDYQPRALRLPPRPWRAVASVWPEDPDDDPDGDDPDGKPDDEGAARPPDPEPPDPGADGPASQAGPPRLAPPMDLPSWETD